MENFFYKLFPKIILENEIVSTIIYNLGIKFTELKNKIDNFTNTDI